MKVKTQNISRKGFVLILAVAALAIFAIMSISMATLALQIRVRSARFEQELGARQAADAGHDMAIFALNQWLKSSGALPTNMTETLAGSTQSYEYTIVQPNTGEWAFDIASHGTYRQAIRSVYSKTVLKSAFEYAMHVENRIELKAKAKLDGYDSRNGSYGGSNSGIPIQIGTNSDQDDMVVLKKGVKFSNKSVIIVGSGAAAAPGDVVDNKSNWGGSILASPKLDFDTVVVPFTNPWTSSKINVPKKKNITITSGQWHVDSVSVNQKSHLIIDGNVTLYVKKDLRIKKDGEIRIENTSESSLKLYMGGDFIAGNSGEVINDTLDPTKLTIYGLPTCTKIILKNGSDFYGAIYAPNTLLDIRNKGDIHGSFVGDKMTLHNRANFYYDYALKDADPGDPGARFVPTRWHEE
jgi:type II secretory pathway pseudopilin PulG